MKDHIPILAMLTALALILIAIVILAVIGLKADGPVLLGMTTAASGMTGAIGGFSMNTRSPNHPPREGQKAQQ